jgi:hypothetical protein
MGGGCCAGAVVLCPLLEGGIMGPGPASCAVGTGAALARDIIQLAAGHAARATVIIPAAMLGDRIV